MVCTVFALMALVVPEIEMFYPILIYALIKEINWQMGLTISMAGVILLGKYGNMHIEIMAKYVVGCLLAAILERKTYKYDKMDIELRKNCGFRRRKSNFFCQKKIRRWQKNRIPKFMQQRFVKEIELQREIHDNVGHVLSRTILLTGAARAINKDQNLDSLLKGLDNSLNSAMDSIRSSVHDLHDDAVNLQETIKGIITDIKIENVEFEYDMSEIIPREIKYCFISIVKEAISNAMKYSSATQIKIIMREHPVIYQLCIEDNGKGCADYDKNTTGIGLKNMQERVNTLNGNLQINGEKGFRIFVVIPKQNRAE